MPQSLLTPVSLSDALVETLRQRILSGEIAPGSALPELEVAATYSVARPTVRAALQALVAMGLLRREPNRSAYVPKLTASDIVDLYFVRRLLETNTIRLLVELGVRPAPAERAVRVLETAGDDIGWSEVVEADLSFHRALVAGVGSERLDRTYALLENEIRLALAQLRTRYGTAKELGGEHRELLDAIESGNADAAAALLGEHLDAAVDALAPRGGAS